MEELRNEYEQLSDEIKLALDAWSAYLITAEEYNYNHTSYALKRKFDEQNISMGRQYNLTDNQFKYALYKNGFIPDNEQEDNWCFKIAEEQKFKW